MEGLYETYCVWIRTHIYPELLCHIVNTVYLDISNHLCIYKLNSTFREFGSTLVTKIRNVTGGIMAQNNVEIKNKYSNQGKEQGAKYKFKIKKTKLHKLR